MNGWSLRRIERLNYLLGGGLTIAAALTQPRAVALGIAVGVALTCLNFFFLRKLIHKWTSEAATGGGSNAPLLVLPKMVGMMLAVVLCLALLPIDGIAFTIGYSVFVVSIFVELILAIVRPVPPVPEGRQESNHG